MIYIFIIYTLYYVVQINNLEIRVGPLNRNGGSNFISISIYYSLCQLLSLVLTIGSNFLLRKKFNLISKTVLDFIFGSSGSTMNTYLWTWSMYKGVATFEEMLRYEPREAEESEMIVC
jgi:hypothetical protein